MEKSLTIKEALQVAIEAEIRACNLYMTTSEKVAAVGTKAMLAALAEEELAHKKLLEDVVENQNYDRLSHQVPKESHGIADFLVVTNLQPNATPQDVLIFAMNEEQKAFKFYSDLAGYFTGTELEKLFSGFAAEEQQHKIRLENEYEAHYMKEN